MQQYMGIRVSIIFYVLVILVISGCDEINVSSYPYYVEFKKDIRLQLPMSLPDISLSIVKTAEWQSPEALFYSGGSWGETRKGVHSAILVRHPQRILLFDSGLGRNIEQQFIVSMPFWLKPFVAYENHQPARDLLMNEVMAYRSIELIILSHSHWDHISGIEDFQDVEEIWATKKAYDWMMSGTQEKSYIQNVFQHSDIKWQFIQFNSGSYENFEQSLDVFQDGSIVLVPLPGHSPGSVGMFVNMRSGKRFFFTGDTTWVLEGFQLPAHKFWASRFLADHDQAEIAQTILKVHQLMREYPDMIIIPAHDYNAQNSNGFFPNIIQ